MKQALEPSSPSSVIWLVVVGLAAGSVGVSWLTAVGIVLFLATDAGGWMKHKTEAAGIHPIVARTGAEPHG